MITDGRWGQMRSLCVSVRSTAVRGVFPEGKVARAAVHKSIEMAKAGAVTPAFGTTTRGTNSHESA